MPREEAAKRREADLVAGYLDDPVLAQGQEAGEGLVGNDPGPLGAHERAYRPAANLLVGGEERPAAGGEGAGLRVPYVPD